MLNCIIEALALAGTLLPLVVVLPLMAALAIGARLVAGVHGDESEPATAGLARGAGLASLLLLAALAVGSFAATTKGSQAFGEWFAAPGFAVNLSFASDTRSLSAVRGRQPLAAAPAPTGPPDGSLSPVWSPQPAGFRRHPNGPSA